MPSATYDLFRTAMLGEKAVACVYDGHPRVVCPVILGRTHGEEKVLAFQVGGTSRSGLPPYIGRSPEQLDGSSPLLLSVLRTAPERHSEEG